MLTLSRKLLFLPLLYSSVVLAQNSTGINGTVTDNSGATVTGSQVEVKNVATGVVNKTVTSSAGTYNFAGVIPGAYEITFTQPGFQTSVHSGVNVEVGRIASIDATLNPGEVSTSVQI